MSDAKGYEELAERLGKVRVARTGSTALANADERAYYVGNGNGKDEEDMTYSTPKDEAEAMLRRAAWEKPAPCVCKGIHDIHTSGEIEQALWLAIEHREKEALLTAECLQTQGRLLANLEAQVKFLLAKVAVMETELLGLRTNIANMEHRCTCKEAQG